MDEPKVGSVAGAVDMTSLSAPSLGDRVPATGISLGLERIIEVVQEFDLLPSPATVAQAAVVVFPETIASRREAGDTFARRWTWSRSLAATATQSWRSAREHAASRKGIPFAVIAGSNELEAGVARRKGLVSGEQTNQPLDQVADYLKSKARFDRRMRIECRVGQGIVR